ncbi:MAG: HEAT repeat domain-containing protein [Chloroflexaceae bacterium]|nr:HEAT repeat domain-containing protein [Chloroflexaceae bacterium]
MFDRKLWREHIDRHLHQLTRNPWQDTALTGAKTVFGYLAMRTIEPLLDELDREPITAIHVLSPITDGVGSNYLVRHAVQFRNRGASRLERDISRLPELRVAIEDMMIALDTINLIRNELNSDRAEKLRDHLIEELDVFGLDSFPRLRQQLMTPRWRSLYDIIRSLRKKRSHYTTEELVLLREGLLDCTPRVRAEAARAIGEFTGEPPESLLTKLLDVALHDCDLEPRNAAACAMGALRERIASQQVLDRLAYSLASDDRFVRTAAAIVLEKLGEYAGHPEAIVRLVQLLLNDHDAYAREAAAHALGHIGAAAARPEVMQALTSAGQDTDENVHEAALEALIRLRQLRGTQSFSTAA